MVHVLFNFIHNEDWWSLPSAAPGCRLTCDWSKWMMTFRSAGRSLGPPLITGLAEGSSCGEKHACSHSVHVIVWNFCILSSLMRIILLRKSLTSWSLMASSSCRPSSGGGGGWSGPWCREKKIRPFWKLSLYMSALVRMNKNNNCRNKRKKQFVLMSM